MATEALLSVRDLRVRFLTEGRSVYAVNGISLDVHRGESVGIVGESGCGKSVTALAIMGILGTAAQTTGSITFDGREILGARDREMRALRGNRIAMIFQDPMTSLNPVLTIGVQLCEVIEAHLDLGGAAAHERAVDLLADVGIANPAERMGAYPHQLSGGMRQRAMIAMALSCDPDLIIADEPTTALDVTVQAQIVRLLRRLVSERDAALVLITHDLGVVAGACSRVLVMYGGTVVEEAATRDLFHEPRHPYTLGLLRSVPRLDSERRSALLPIDGSPPHLSAPLTECPFHPRCDRARIACRSALPTLTSVGEGHLAACVDPVPLGAARATGAAL